MVHARTAIVIGASAGGVLALVRLAAHLPARLPAAVLMVQHTRPGEPSNLARVIGRNARMPVRFAEDGEPVEEGRIYVAPPGPHTTVAAPGRIRLVDAPPDHHARPSADALFRSAAALYRSRTIGVVLTGYDGDGTAGLIAIKRAGGISIIQNPRTAAVPDMPQSALEGDHPDYCVSLWQLPRLLQDLLIDLDRHEVRVIGAPAAAAGAVHPWPLRRWRSDD